MTLHLIGTWLNINSLTYRTRFYSIHQLSNSNNPALPPVHAKINPPTSMGACTTSLVSIPMHGCLPFYPFYTKHLHAYPLYPKHPKLPYTPISVVPSLVSIHIYLGNLTFSLRPDEGASVWRQQKLVCNNCE